MWVDDSPEIDRCPRPRTGSLHTLGEMHWCHCRTGWTLRRERSPHTPPCRWRFDGSPPASWYLGHTGMDSSTTVQPHARERKVSAAGHLVEVNIISKDIADTRRSCHTQIPYIGVSFEATSNRIPARTAVTQIKKMCKRPRRNWFHINYICAWIVIDSKGACIHLLTSTTKAHLCNTFHK